MQGFCVENTTTIACIFVWSCWLVNHEKQITFIIIFGSNVSISNCKIIQYTSRQRMFPIILDTLSWFPLSLSFPKFFGIDTLNTSQGLLMAFKMLKNQKHTFLVPRGRFQTFWNLDVWSSFIYLFTYFMVQFTLPTFPKALSRLLKHAQYLEMYHPNAERVFYNILETSCWGPNFTIFFRIL